MEYKGGDGTGDEDRVKMEWEIGLPTHEELIPINHCLISPKLAYAFGIVLEPCINQASQDTLASLGSGSGSQSKPLSTEDGSESRKRRKLRSIDVYTEETDLSLDLNRGRLVWTPQIHKRFTDVVAHLGIKDADPKTIIKLMNVEGLTRENISTHLQKYRLYLDRMERLSNEETSSNHLFAFILVLLLALLQTAVEARLLLAFLHTTAEARLLLALFQAAVEASLLSTLLQADVEARLLQLALL
ncbi:transcription factor LUX-like [Impatiens glandulifera]|uniref:transcription factor LUX-like n=1 Tax=Impatiens glandulifera TaxID=253017 RepID=UPI001FB1562C|nr:transcription factor LUX-like [Impatiens glandulifera]